MQDDNVKVTCALVDHPPIKMALAYRFDTANRSVVFLRQYPKDRLPDRPRQSGRCPGLRRAIPPWNSRTCRPAGRPRIYSYARRPRSNPAGAAALLAHPIVSTSDPELPLRVKLRPPSRSALGQHSTRQRTLWLSVRYDCGLSSPVRAAAFRPE
jgi:hypothetical protein